MGLLITDLDGHNPPIELMSDKLHIRHQPGFIEIFEADGGIIRMMLTAPRAVLIEVCSNGCTSPDTAIWPRARSRDQASLPGVS